MGTGSGPSLTSSLMQALTEIESRFPVAQWSVGSVPIWPLMRVRWFLGEWASHYVAPASGAGAKAKGLAMRLLTGPARAMLAQSRDRQHAPSGSLRRDLLFLSDGVSYGKLGGRWVERFCDPVIRAAAARGLTSLLLSPSYAFRLPRATPSRFIQPKLDRANALGALLAATSRGEAHLPGIEGVCAWVVAQGFGASFLHPEKVLSDGLRLAAQSRVHARLLRQTRPRLAFVVSYYGIEGMAFVLACHRAGVTVVDLQHGAPGELHPAYAGLPKPLHRVHALVPDRFWVWSDWERRLIANWAADTGHRAVVGGDPWMSVWEDHRGWPGVKESSAQADALLARAAGRPVVLITLQWGFKESEQLEPMQRVIAAGQGRCEFWVRLHPSMLERREQVRALLKTAGRHELDEPTDLPLQAVLSRSTVHVTHSSSTAVEAAQFGVPTVVTSDLGAELYVRLSEAGWVVTETGDASRLITVLEDLATRRRTTPPPRRVPLDEALDELLGESPPHPGTIA